MDCFVNCCVHEDTSVVSLAVEGVSKALLWDRFENEQLLAALVVLYFHPESENMHHVRQCLSYFFSSYSRSTFKHQLLLQKVHPPGVLMQQGFLHVPDDIGGFAYREERLNAFAGEDCLTAGGLDQHQNPSLNVIKLKG